MMNSTEGEKKKEEFKSVETGSLTPSKKKCQVCGDNAMGFNFNGLSCESCKAFFRRSAFKHKEYKCRSHEACEITKQTRKFCKLCRLNKCFSIGMKKELIYPNRQEWQENRLQEQLNSEPSLEEEEEEKPNTTDGPFTYNATFRVTLIPRNCFPPTELLHFEEIQRAMAVFSDEANLEVTDQAQNMVQALNQPAVYLRKIIRFCKNIAAYKCLKQDDQITILKTFFHDILSTRFCFMYSREKDGFPMLANEEQDRLMFIKLDLCKESKKDDVGSIFRRYMTSFHIEMENDVFIRDLIIALILFKSQSNLSCPEYIRYQFYVYNRLFRRYLESKYQSTNKADQKYCSIMLFLNEMDYIRNIVRELYLEIEISQIAQVLAEIYNLF